MAGTAPGLWQKLRTLLSGSAAQAGSPVAAVAAPAAGTAEFSLKHLDNPGSAIAFGYRIIFLGLGSFFFWAITAPLGEGVPAPGVVVVESHRKAVSHLAGGTVATVHVRENQQVKEGDVLLTLDATRTQSVYDTLLNEYIAAAAKLARLSAEQAFSTEIKFPEDVRRYAEQLGRLDVMQLQIQLFRTRQQAIDSEQAILRENLFSSQIQASGARQQLAARQRQISLLREELQGNKSLADEGYLPRNRVLEQERQMADLSSVTSDLQARIAQQGSSGSEIRLRLLQRRQEYLKEVETQATDARREVASLNERLKDARLDLDRTTVRAPVSGQVVAMLPQASGTVITPGSKLMEVVPEGDKLLLDVQVPITIANRVKPGLATDIRITTFPETPSLVIDGRVQSISSDRHEPSGIQPYYLARIEVTPEGVAKLQGRQLRPGMSTDVVIKTGERSFMSYLMAPVTRRLFESFREP